MSERIPTRRDVPAPRSASDDPVLVVGGSFTIATGWLYTLPLSAMSWHTTGIHQSDLTDAHILYTVTTPPAHGALLKDGASTSQFTQQDVHDGRIAYHHDGGPSTTDSYQVFATITEDPGVARPYTPLFYFTAGTPNGEVNGEACAGVVLAGATQMPRLDYAAGAFGTQVSGSDHQNVTFSFQTTRPNTGVYLWTTADNLTWGAYDAPGYLPPIATTSVTYSGLTFTKLGTLVFHQLVYDLIHLWYNYNTVNCELWYAPAPSVLPSATFTVTYPYYEDDFHPGSMNPHPYETFAMAQNYYGLADINNPTLGIAGAIQMFTTNTLPPRMNMTTTVSDQLVSPVIFYRWGAADDYGSVPYNNDPPKGYTQAGGGGGAGGGFGEGTSGAVQRNGYCYGTISISIVAAAPAAALTDAELVFSPTIGFVDFNSAVNRRLFVASTATPQWMGTNGALAFSGNTPPVYLSTVGAPADFAANNGDGGAFAPSGTLGAADGPGCTDYVITEVAGPVSNPMWRLSVSDDGSRTWSTLVKPREVGTTGDYRQRLRWLKMGHFRQRSMKLECTDPVRRNIIGIYIDTEQGMG